MLVVDTVWLPGVCSRKTRVGQSATALTLVYVRKQKLNLYLLGLETTNAALCQ